MQQGPGVQHPDRSEAASSRPLRLLVVDDHDDSRNVLVRLLSRSYDISAAASYRSALEVAAELRPDVVISDIRLGDDGPDGLELMRELRRRYGVQGIAVSGHAMDDHVLRDAGFVAYLLKPILFERLLDTVEAVCAATAAAS